MPTNINGLRKLAQKLHNHLLKPHFDDLQERLDNVSGFSLTSVKELLEIENNETMQGITLKSNLLMFYLRVASDLQRPFYGIPKDLYDDFVKYKPQIKLFFRQDLDAVPIDSYPLEAEYSFRIQDKDLSTNSPDENSDDTVLRDIDLKELANRIYDLFCDGQGYTFTKGKVRVNYWYPEMGYRLSIPALNESEGVGLIRQILEIQNHVYIDDKKSVSTPEKASKSNKTPSTKKILGETVYNPRYLPTGIVRFQYALVHLNGVKRDIYLVDRSGYHPNALIQKIGNTKVVNFTP